MVALGQNSISSGEQKRQFGGLFRDAAAVLKAPPVLSYTWLPSSTVGEIGWDWAGRVWVRINLRIFSENHTLSDGGQRFFIEYICFYLVHRLRAMEEAGQTPLTYLEGLAHLEDLSRREERRSFPLCCLCFPRPLGRRFCFTPASLFCAVSALEKARERWGSFLSAGESEILSKRTTELAALAALPEIGYYKDKMPESSLIWTLRQTGRLLARKPALANEAVLSPLVWNAGTLCTPEQLLTRWEETGNPLCLGLALRFLALSGGLAAALAAETPELRNAVCAYRRDCVRLARLRTSSPALLADTLAAEKIIAPLNRCWEQAGEPAGSETVRPMGDVWR